MNLVLVVLDTLRQDHVGAYGNPWIKTPNLDRFAAESLVFTRAYPESLPTLCFRRAIHTGRRTYPYVGHREYKGDFRSVAPGWGPIPEEQTTVAEWLGSRGYLCALISDNYHMFKPSKNFHRGFHQWTWIRGQELDPHRSGPPAPPEMVAAHMSTPPAENPGLANYLRRYLTNTGDAREDAASFPAQVFTAASDWIEQNRDAHRFFLLVDSFDPHEPWHPPIEDRRLYDDDGEANDLIQTLYGPWEGRIGARDLRRLQANYAGEVTLVDRWFGRLFDTLEAAGTLEDTVVAVLSDHGHNLGYAPQDRGLVSKQGHPMSQSVAQLVAMIRHPAGRCAGLRSNALLYNHDLIATLLGLIDQMPDHAIDGEDFWPSAEAGNSVGRGHVTIGWGPLVTVITDEWWYNASIWGEGELLHRLDDDAALLVNLADRESDLCTRLRALAIADAGDAIPDEFRSYHNKPGCTPFEVRYEALERLVAGPPAT
jgi:arylsulfatase A-like enzyme